MFDSKITIIGAGAVGLAIAAKISEFEDSVFVIEQNMFSITAFRLGT